MKRGILLAALGALLAGAAIGYFALRPAMSPPRTDREPGHALPSGGSATPEPGATQGEATPTEPDPSHSDLIVVDSPKPGALATSPLSVLGRARGNWYFEAEFPARLFDASGTQLTWGSARAQGEWMTSDFVPFAVILSFSPPTTSTGTLVLERSNPSGLPENAGEVRIPVRFR